MAPRLLTKPSVLLLTSLLISAFLLDLAMSFPRLAWVATLSLVPFFTVIRVVRPVGAFLWGALWGVSLFLFSLSGPAIWIPAGLESLALVTLAPAVYAGLAAAVTRRVGFNALLLAGGWLGLEVALRPLGLPNGLLAQTQKNGALLHIVGGLFGYGFVAFLVAFANVALVSLLERARFRPWRSSAFLVWQNLRDRLPLQPDSCLRVLVASFNPARAPPTGSREIHRSYI